MEASVNAAGSARDQRDHPQRLTGRSQHSAEGLDRPEKSRWRRLVTVELVTQQSTEVVVDKVVGKRGLIEPQRSSGRILAKPHEHSDRRSHEQLRVRGQSESRGA